MVTSDEDETHFQIQHAYFMAEYRKLYGIGTSPYTGWHFFKEDTQSKSDNPGRGPTMANIADFELKLALSPILAPATVVTGTVALVLAAAVAVLHLICSVVSVTLDSPELVSAYCMNPVYT